MVEKDKELIERIIGGDTDAIQDFLFVRMKEAFAYIAQYFSRDPVTADDVLNEAYLVLSANDWHKLRLFQGTCSLKTYVTVIMARHFQHKRNVLIGVDDNALAALGGSTTDSECSFMMADIKKILSRFKPMDQLILKRVMIDGEKPGDILDEVRALAFMDEDSKVREHDDEKLADYVYVRYFRAKAKFRKKMEEYGYGR